jgi:hypothetical protein
MCHHNAPKEKDVGGKGREGNQRTSMMHYILAVTRLTGRGIK